MTIDIKIKLTDQETKIINHLISRNHTVVFWEELAQFYKEPQTVKLNSIKRSISEIRRKYNRNSEMIPFQVTFKNMPSEKTNDIEIYDTNFDIVPFENGDIFGIIEHAECQNLVKLHKPSIIATITSTPIDDKSILQNMFVLDKNYKCVRTKYGRHLLNDREWDMFNYFYENIGKRIYQSELKDKVVFPLWGSKTPARWFDIIGGIIGKLRRQVTGLDCYLTTLKGKETGYIFSL